MWGLLIAAVILAGLFVSEVFWELLAGVGLLGFFVCIAQGEIATALFALALLAACIFHWRVA